MTPVINPWIFYLMSVVDTLKFGAIIVAVALAMLMPIWLVESDHPERVSTLLAVAIALSIFVPSEKTVTKMVLAQNVTYERVEAVTDTVETVYNDIMDLFEED